jgi:hypothetical protein
MKARRLRPIVSALLGALLVVGFSVVGATASGAAGPISRATLPSPSPIPTDSPSPSPTPTDSPCSPDEDCVDASDQVDMFDDGSPAPSPSPTGAPAVAAAGNSRLLAAAVPFPCGTAGLSARLRGPRGGLTANLTGQFTVVSTVGAPITVNARRTITANGLVTVFNDGGGSPIPIWIVNYGPILLLRPVTVNVTETGGVAPAPFFTYGAGRTCRGTRPLRVNVALP